MAIDRQHTCIDVFTIHICLILQTMGALGCYFVMRGNNQRSRSNVFALVIVSHYAYLLMPDVAKRIVTNVY